MSLVKDTGHNIRYAANIAAMKRGRSLLGYTLVEFAKTLIPIFVLMFLGVSAANAVLIVFGFVAVALIGAAAYGASKVGRFG